MSANVSVRFHKLDKMQALTLEREIKGASYKTEGSIDVFVGYVPLYEHYIDDIDTFFVRQHIPLDALDVLISIDMKSENFESQVPPIVNQFLKHINCGLTVSYIPQSLGD